MKKWLNGDFYNSAFNTNDKQKILKTNNKSIHYKNYNNKNSKEILTEDYVFALSNEEAKRCFYNRNHEIVSIKPT